MKTIVLDNGNTLDIRKYGKCHLLIGQRRHLDRTVYLADDGSYWARYDDMWHELEMYCKDEYGTHFRPKYGDGRTVYVRKPVRG